jgi:hypothetical protein
MSGEKKRHPWRYSPPLIKENLIINSTSSTTTTTTRTHEEKHTKHTQSKWYNDDDDDNDDDIQLTTLLPTETISEKIDRVLKKINAWTNESTTTTNNSNNNNSIQQETTFNKIIKPLSNYDNIPRQQHESYFTKPTYTSLFNSFRRRCSSSTYNNPSMIKPQQISTHRPYSMTFIDEPSPIAASYNPNSFYERPHQTKPIFRRQSSLGPSRYPTQRQSMYSPMTNLKSLSSLYGSDFFYPSVSEEEQHQYDNLTFSQNPHHDNPFPTIVVDCQRCSRSVDRSSLRDISCQVPSDEELYQDIQLEQRQTSRSSPLYRSPRSSPPPCHPPMAKSLLAPYHFRRKHSLASYISFHNRSKSVPSSSSTSSSKKSNRKTCLPPSLSPLPITAESNPVPSTTTLLRSIKTSIHAMKKRLKDIRRLSEVGRSV